MTDADLRTYRQLPFAESFCTEGATDRLCAALGCTPGDIDTLTFRRCEIALTDDQLDCLWTPREWAAELAERRGYLGRLAANIDAAPEPILAPNLTGAPRPAYTVIDGVHRLNCALHRGRTTAAAWVAQWPPTGGQPSPVRAR